MPRIFDNIDQRLLPALCDTLKVSERADFCVGYFNLRGWKKIDTLIDAWDGGDGACCRLLVGMQTLPHEELRAALSLLGDGGGVDQQGAIQLRKRLAEEFRQQLSLGAPSNEDEAGLRRLAEQLKNKKVVVKLFLRHTLHAKLYLLFRQDPNNPTVGFLGSSNLTLAGLSKQGELNVDILDHDACQKLEDWFNDRWNDNWCLDISKELQEVINTSWAAVDERQPYHIYLKIAYHLAEEARCGLSEFRISRDFGNRLFEFQKAAVKIAAHHINKRDGVLIGDVVGLGKTLMATALARVFQDDYSWETLIVCPKNLTKMWQSYVDQYRLIAKVLPSSKLLSELPNLRRYRLVVVDESHNMRNRAGKRFRALQEYISENESHCVLLTATPYNKTYTDLSSQLRLFVPGDRNLGIRPENKLREIGETEFIRRHQCPLNSLAAFEKSEYADDWRELMRLYMIRRTRTFIQDNYAETDAATGRKYLTFEDGTRSYFPTRVPRTVKFKVDEGDTDDQYGRLFAQETVDAINALELPRYGMGNYIEPAPTQPPTKYEGTVLDGLSLAGKRLMGFCRTNLFKRLESGGQAFLQSVERHILRNMVFLHALENDLPLPVGSQSAEMLDARLYDGDADATDVTASIFDDDNDDDQKEEQTAGTLRTEGDYQKRAASVYKDYSTQFKRRFQWVSPSLFNDDLADHLRSDARALLTVLKRCGEWDADKDTKLTGLVDLISKQHPDKKVIVFTQFADTVRYLEEHLRRNGISKMAGVTGQSSDPTGLAWRFSPVSNEKPVEAKQELRVLVATDVLSEGQNLQDCAIIVNYDLPWAIIRLIQRAGRVDRIGQKSDEIICYSFLPADGVERIIKLRARVRTRLRENAEVVGTDEAFFEDDQNADAILDLYNEKAGILDGDADGEVDLASQAYQIWKNAIEADPSLERKIIALPSVVYATKAHLALPAKPNGVLVYMKTLDGNDALAWVDENGKSVTQSQVAILRAAECNPNTHTQPRNDRHHELVRASVKIIGEQTKAVGGQLGRPSGARFRTYERLKSHLEEMRANSPLLVPPLLEKTLNDIYRYPLRQASRDSLNRQLRSGASNEDLAYLVVSLWEEDRLCLKQEEVEQREPQIICSMGLFPVVQG